MTTANIKVLFDARVIAARVQNLGQRLQREVAPEDPLVLTLLGGSVIFLADLIRAISSPLRYEFVQVEYTHHEHGEQVTDIHYPLPVDLHGQSVLVIKDVVSTAIIETYLSNQFLQRGARKIRFVALVDLPKERRTHCQIDYSVFTTERSARLVGYGMKHRGRYGSLPYVGYLMEEESSPARAG
jgi:hypoxanthine phosphoribosyltransferase